MKNSLMEFRVNVISQHEELWFSYWAKLANISITKVILQSFFSFFKKNHSISCIVHKNELTLQSQKSKRSLG